jgi:hypothetical protein
MPRKTPNSDTEHFGIFAVYNVAKGYPVMLNSTVGQPARSWEFLRSPVNLLAVRTTVRDLRKSGTSATLTRLFESNHVRDLKLIAGGASWIMLVGILVILAVFIHDVIPQNGAPSAASTPQIWKTIEDSLKTIAALIAIGGAVIAWVYRTASVRLGVVDLFASEITTLCRVGTIVDMGQRSIAAFDYVGSNAGPTKNGKKPPTQQRYTPHRFISEENYFPVFSGNAKDLEVLEANVVIHVTAFYTYMRWYVITFGKQETYSRLEPIERWHQIGARRGKILYTCYFWPTRRRETQSTIWLNTNPHMSKTL